MKKIKTPLARGVASAIAASILIATSGNMAAATVPASLANAITEAKHFSSGQTFTTAKSLITTFDRTWPSVSTYWCAWMASFFMRGTTGLSKTNWTTITSKTGFSLFSASDVFREVLLHGSLQKTPTAGDFVAYYSASAQTAVNALENKPSYKDSSKSDAYLKPFSHCGFVRSVSNGQATVVEGDVGTYTDYTKNVVTVRTFSYTGTYAYGSMKFAFARPIWP